jgi:hypothetical protein
MTVWSKRVAKTLTYKEHKIKPNILTHRNATIQGIKITLSLVRYPASFISILCEEAKRILLHYVFWGKGEYQLKILNFE